MVGKWKEIYKNNNEIMAKYRYAMIIMMYDATTDCPLKGREYSYDVQQFFRTKMLELTTSNDYIEAVKGLYANKNSLDEVLALQVEEDYKNIQKQEKTPKDELIKHFANTSRASMAWEKARTGNHDFTEFKNELKELVEYNKKYIGWMNKDVAEPFDVLIDDMEAGFTSKKYDEFFGLLKREIVPLAKKIISMNKKLYNPKLDTLTFDIDKQKKLTKYIMDTMEYTNEVGCCRETLHPFTIGMNSNDARITTRYKENALFANIYAIMHETGHALYQLGIYPKFEGTNLHGGATMAIHESQSRFMENYIGRRRSFIHFLYPKLMELFPVELEGITEDDIYYYVNRVTDGTIRMESDELTYSIHIMIRYEIEEMLFRNQITVDEIPTKFNDLMEEYIGVRPKDDNVGCFQDNHWASRFAYFPTYALGNAFGAQYYYKMIKDIDIDSALEMGDFKPINTWLDEKIHKYGKSKQNLWLVRNASGHDFDPNYYVKYLKEKFEAIYNIK